MLAITIKPGQSGQVGAATVHNTGSSTIRVGVEAPPAVLILRSDAKRIGR